MRIHSGVSTEQPLHHLFFGHLQAKNRHRPLLLETPKGKDLAEDVENLAILRRLAGGRRP